MADQGPFQDWLGNSATEGSPSTDQTNTTSSGPANAREPPEKAARRWHAASAAPARVRSSARRESTDLQSVSGASHASSSSSASRRAAAERALELARARESAAAARVRTLEAEEAVHEAGSEETSRRSAASNRSVHLRVTEDEDDNGNVGNAGT